MSVHIQTDDELYREWDRLDRAIGEADPCDHLHYRYQMDTCNWCSLHKEFDRIGRVLDRSARARIGAAA